MNPNEHNPRRAVRFALIGVFVVVVGVFVAIYNREIRGHLGLLRDTANASRASGGESSLFNITDSLELTTLAESDSGIELPPSYDLREPEFDLTKDQSDVCPVHNVRTTPKIIALFSWDAKSVAEFDKRKDAEFPFAYAISHGSYLSLIHPPIPLEPPKRVMSFVCGYGYFGGPPPREARVLVCFQCVAAYERAVRAFNAKVVATFEAQRAEEARRVAPKQQ